jgi:hypothetical protein
MSKSAYKPGDKVLTEIPAASAKLKPGDVVKIFQKPLTDEDYEGTARVEAVIDHCAEFDLCTVRFLMGTGEGAEWERETFERQAFARNIVPDGKRKTANIPNAQ